jgi:hypothetical protein
MSKVPGTIKENNMLYFGFLFLVTGFFFFFDIRAVRKNVNSVEEYYRINKGSDTKGRIIKSKVMAVVLILIGLCFIVRAYWH